MAADRLRTRGSVRTAVVWRSVRTLLVDLIDTTGREQLDVLDAGGGTGGFAVPLAELGHRVTVVDASPDSLAALVRRAADAGVTDRVRSVQGDAASLLDVVAPSSFDLVVLHSVLEIVDDPAAALAAVAGVLRPGGIVSVVAANRIAAVLHRAAAGVSMRRSTPCVIRSGGIRPQTRRLAGSLSPTSRRCCNSAGLTVIATHGSRVFADLVPGGSLDADPAAVEALIALEFEASELPAFRDIATQLHVVGRRS